MENTGKVISKQEVSDLLIRNILNDQEEFRNARSVLRHGQKDRLMEAMAGYPLIDSQFDESEPELRSALAIWKRISDSLVAIGTEAAIDGILNGIKTTQGETNVETTEE
jgi:hypothetical protein